MASSLSNVNWRRHWTHNLLGYASNRGCRYHSHAAKLLQHKEHLVSAKLLAGQRDKGLVMPIVEHKLLPKRDVARRLVPVAVSAAWSLARCVKLLLRLALVGVIAGSESDITVVTHSIF